MLKSLLIGEVKNMVEGQRDEESFSEVGDSIINGLILKEARQCYLETTIQ
jgi:hypothetical protein